MERARVSSRFATVHARLYACVRACVRAYNRRYGSTTRGMYEAREFGRMALAKINNER